MKKIISVPLLILLLFVLSCKKDKSVNTTEPVKEITGNWKIIKAVRNGADLTQRFDFSAFRINFSDSSYTISNQVPFVVNKNGKWSFDDPQYPFKMFFTAQSETAKTTSILYPVVGGVRNLVISFNPGCATNVYQYTLQKAN